MDDTLYPLSSGLNLACRKNIEGMYARLLNYKIRWYWCLVWMMRCLIFWLLAEFMLQHLHIDENEVPKMCLDLYKEYGTTMAGLKVKIVQLTLCLELQTSMFFLTLTLWSVNFIALQFTRQYVSQSSFSFRLLAMNLTMMNFILTFMENYHTRLWNPTCCWGTFYFLCLNAK